MIKFYLNKFHKKLQFQIIDQNLSDNLLSKLRNGGVTFEPKGKSGIRIRIFVASAFFRAYPHIYKNTYDTDRGTYDIYLRGANSSKDLYVVLIDCKSNENRDDLYDSILYAFTELKKLN